LLSLLLRIYLQSRRLRRRQSLRSYRSPKQLLSNVEQCLVEPVVPDDPEQFERIWEDWLNGTGLDLEGEIEETLENSKFLMDMDDGTHAQWRDGQLGVLILLSREEVEILVNATHRGQGIAVEDWLMVSSWTLAFTSFLERCLLLEEPDGSL